MIDFFVSCCTHNSCPFYRATHYIVTKKMDKTSLSYGYTVCPGSISDPFYIVSLLYKMENYFLDIQYLKIWCWNSKFQNLFIFFLISFLHNLSPFFPSFFLTKTFFSYFGKLLLFINLLIYLYVIFTLKSTSLSLKTAYVTLFSFIHCVRLW